MKRRKGESNEDYNERSRAYQHERRRDPASRPKVLAAEARRRADPTYAAEHAAYMAREYVELARMAREYVEKWRGK